MVVRIIRGSIVLKGVTEMTDENKIDKMAIQSEIKIDQDTRREMRASAFYVTKAVISRTRAQ